jgi:phage terminase small subunit
MPGRRPKPTKLKLMKGTSRVDRERVGEPEPPEGEIVRPAFLHKHREIELWEEYSPGLIAMGTLTWIDVPNFARWCVKMAQFEDEKGQMKSSDLAQIRMLESDLGIGASARAKLGTGKGKEKDPADAFFKKA